MHERSFTLKLPGEDIGRRGRQWQVSAGNKLREMRRALGSHRALRHFNGLEKLENCQASIVEL